MTATKTKPKTTDYDPALHDAAIQLRANLKARHAAEWAAVEGEQAAAKAAADEARKPFVREAAANKRMADLAWAQPRELMAAEQGEINTAHPALAKEITRLEHEILSIGTLFRVWAEPGEDRPPSRCSNVNECDSYRISCQSAIAELRSFQAQKHDAESALAKIRELRAASAPRPDSVGII